MANTGLFLQLFPAAIVWILPLKQEEAVYTLQRT